MTTPSPAGTEALLPLPFEAAMLFFLCFLATGLGVYGWLGRDSLKAPGRSERREVTQKLLARTGRMQASSLKPDMASTGPVRT